MQGLPLLRNCCSQNFSQMEKVGANEINFSQGFSQKEVFIFNSLPARGDFSCRLFAFAKSLDPDQARQNAGPDLDPDCLVFTP